MKNYILTISWDLWVIRCVIGRSGQEVEIEDIFGEMIILPSVKIVLGKAIKITDEERKIGGLVNQIKVAAKRQGVELPGGWKASVAIQLVSTLAEKKTALSDTVLDTAAMLFSAIRKSFEELPVVEKIGAV